MTFRKHEVFILLSHLLLTVVIIKRLNFSHKKLNTPNCMTHSFTRSSYTCYIHQLVVWDMQRIFYHIHAAHLNIWLYQCGKLDSSTLLYCSKSHTSDKRTCNYIRCHYSEIYPTGWKVIQWDIVLFHKKVLV